MIRRLDPARGPLPPEQADLVLAELTVLAPNGVEEERGPGYVEYAIYGGEGELPELGELDAAVGEGRVEVSCDRDPRRLGRPLARLPQAAAGRRPPLAAPLLGAARGRAAIDVVVDPGQAFGTGAHPTTRLCLELLLRAGGRRGGGPLTDLGTGSGVLAIAAAKLGWDPGPRLRPRAGRRSRPQPPTQQPTTSSSRLERINLREHLPELAPTVVANMTAPILLAVAAQLVSVEGGRAVPETARLLRALLAERGSTRLLDAFGRCRA